MAILNFCITIALLLAGCLFGIFAFAGILAIYKMEMYERDKEKSNKVF